VESGEVETGFKETISYEEDNQAVEQVAQRGCGQLHLVLELTLLSAGWEGS